MYGLGSLIGSALNAMTMPALGAYASEFVGKEIPGLLTDIGLEKGTAELLGQVGGTLAGAGAGALGGAGLGALFGGGPGAAGGALSGGISGGFGGYKSDEIMQSLGQSPNPIQAPSQVQAHASPRVADFGNPQDITNQGLPTDMLPSPGSATIQKTEVKSMIPPPQAPTPADAIEKPKVNLGDYMDIAGKAALPAFTLGGGLTQQILTNQAIDEQNEAEEEERAAKTAQIRQLTGNIYGPRGFAGGGGLDMSVDYGVPTKVHFPEWFLDDYARTGGLAALTDAYAAGGYIDNEPVDTEANYPQSRIPNARSYRGSAPNRHEVINNFEDGGLLEGEGDGMSDSIPASISGQEPARVADGEYVVPVEIANSMESRLDKMLTAVRKAAHAKHGEQIQQDAAKRAFIQVMTGIRA